MNWGLPPAGLKIIVADHMPDVAQLLLEHHPVTHRSRVRVAYVPVLPPRAGWHVRRALIAEHGLSDRHIELIQSLLEEHYASLDQGANSGS